VSGQRSHHVAEAGFFVFVVARAALLVERLDFEQRGVFGPFAQVFGIGHGFVESGF
jgi:hypothetical protein